MSRAWKPGDVALYGGSISVVVDRCSKHFAQGPHWHHTGDGGGWDYLNDALSLGKQRPVVVIDPEDLEQVERLVRAFWAANTDYAIEDAFPMRAALRSLIADPKPDEPQGLGAVVEDDKGKVYVRGYEPGDLFTHPWHIIDPSATACMAWWKWDDITAVRVLGEGVTS